MKASAILVDEALYPRTAFDLVHVDRIKEALRSGGRLPPIVVAPFIGGIPRGEKERGTTHWLVDGRHRLQAQIQLAGHAVDVEVEERVYQSPADLFEDALRLNSRHGLPFTGPDQLGAVRRAYQLGLSIERTAAALSLTVATTKDMRLRPANYGRGLGLQLAAIAHGPQPITKGGAAPYGEARRSAAPSHSRPGEVTAESWKDVLDAVNRVIRLIEQRGPNLDHDMVAKRIRALEECLEGYLAVGSP